MKYWLIALGGGSGAVLRYLVSDWGQRYALGAFPTGTLAVNVVGCLLIGFLGALAAGSPLMREEARFLLVVGLLGGFTTFSTFGYQTFSLLEARQWAVAVAYVLASNGVGLLAVWLGFRLSSLWQGSPPVLGP